MQRYSLYRRYLPSPVSSGALFVIWLLINQTLAPGHILLALLLAISVPLLTRRLQPLGDPLIRRPLLLMRLLAMAWVEIVRSCINVSGIILRVNMRGGKRVESQFIRVPLELENPYALALLSCLINTTPGTVWVEIRPGSHELALHVFDLHDPQWWVETIKTRYEQPLLEIFGRRQL